MVTSLARKYTKRGDLMATFVLEDLAAAMEVMVFPQTMTDYGHLLEDDAIVCVKGRLDLRDDQPKIIAMEISRPELMLDSGPPVRIKLRAKRPVARRAGSQRLKEILREHPGDSPVFVHLEGADKHDSAAPRRRLLRRPGNGLFAELRVLLGADCIA